MTPLEPKIAPIKPPLQATETPPDATCPKCGKPGTGQYCGQCGTALTPSANHPSTDPSSTKKNPYVSFADSFVGLEGYAKFWRTYLSMLGAPVQRTLELFARLELKDAIRFFQNGFFYYVVFSGAKLALSGFDFLGAEVLSKALVAVNYLLILYFYNRFCRRHFATNRSHDDYVRMYTLFAGFSLPLMGLSTLVGGLISREPLVSTALSGIVSYLILFLYGGPIWSFYWQTKSNRVISLLMTAGAVAFLCVFIPTSIAIILINDHNFN